MININISALIARVALSMPRSTLQYRQMGTERRNVKRVKLRVQQIFSEFLKEG